jgi:hypothetical protein
MALNSNEDWYNQGYAEAAALVLLPSAFLLSSTTPPHLLGENPALMTLIRNYRAVLAYTRLDEELTDEEVRVHLRVYKIALEHCESININLQHYLAGGIDCLQDFHLAVLNDRDAVSSSQEALNKDSLALTEEREDMRSKWKDLAEKEKVLAEQEKFLTTKQTELNRKYGAMTDKCYGIDDRQRDLTKKEAEFAAKEQAASDLRKVRPWKQYIWRASAAAPRRDAQTSEPTPWDKLMSTVYPNGSN